MFTSWVFSQIHCTTVPVSLLEWWSTQRAIDRYIQRSCRWLLTRGRGECSGIKIFLSIELNDLYVIELSSKVVVGVKTSKSSDCSRERGGTQQYPKRNLNIIHLTEKPRAVCTPHPYVGKPPLSYPLQEGQSRVRSADSLFWIESICLGDYFIFTLSPRILRHLIKFRKGDYSTSVKWSFRMNICLMVSQVLSGSENMKRKFYIISYLSPLNIELWMIFGNM